jgi:hypothetical protein
MKHPTRYVDLRTVDFRRTPPPIFVSAEVNFLYRRRK